MPRVRLGTLIWNEFLKWMCVSLAAVVLAFGVLPQALRQAWREWKEAKAALARPRVGTIILMPGEARDIERSAAAALHKLDEYDVILDLAEKRLKERPPASTDPEGAAGSVAIQADIDKERTKAARQRTAIQDLQAAAQQAMADCQDGICRLDGDPVTRALLELGLPLPTRPGQEPGQEPGLGRIALEMVLRSFQRDPDAWLKPASRPADESSGRAAGPEGK